jgi:hypothetical protein
VGLHSYNRSGSENSSVPRAAEPGGVPLRKSTERRRPDGKELMGREVDHRLEAALEPFLGLRVQRVCNLHRDTKPEADDLDRGNYP